MNVFKPVDLIYIDKLERVSFNFIFNSISIHNSFK